MTDDEIRELVERLRSTATLPVCPYDRRSPDYWTTPDDKPCVICGQENTTEGPDKCRGADTRIMEDAAALIAAQQERLKLADEVIRPFADAVDTLARNAERLNCKPGRPKLLVPYDACEAAKSFTEGSRRDG